MANLQRIEAEVQAQLRGPGCEFETGVEEVLGERHLVFLNRHRSVAAMMNDDTRKWADRCCLVMHDTRIDYSELASRVAATSRRLRTRYGISKGHRVAILAANCPEWVITFFAVTSLGAIVAAVNGWWTATELRHAITLTEPLLVVGDSRRLDRVGGFPAQVAVLDLTAEPEFFLPAHADGLDDDTSNLGTADLGVDITEDDPALILFTSGTTGRSKAATISHRGLAGFVDGVAYNTREKTLIAMKMHGINSADLPADQNVHLVTAPLFHVSGLLAGVLNNMRNGSKIVFREGRFDAGDVLRIIESERVTHWTAIGTMTSQVLEHPDIETRDLSSIQSITTGGAHFTSHTRSRIAKRFPQVAKAFGQGYGSSETVGVVCTIGGSEFVENPSATGRVNLGFEVEIRDEADNVLPEGVDGHVHVRSAYTMLGYWGDEQATASCIKPRRWLDTGDWGCIKGGLLHLNARARDMIIRSGENIYPTEIEQRLDAYPDVAESAVIGVNHHDHGQEVKAVVVPNTDKEIDTSALADWCSQTMAAYKIPTHWEIRDNPLPRNAAGKIVKAAIRDQPDHSTNHDRPS